jgi:RNA polymerase sigma-70 factor (ECF subfamily)
MQGKDIPDAQDLTQGFFAWILQRDFLGKADPAKGKFRSFLLKALRYFLKNEHDRATCQKRGGGRVIVSLDDTAEDRFQREPAHEMTAEKIYDRRWALTLIECAMERLRDECAAEGKSEFFEKVEPSVFGQKMEVSYPEAAAKLGLKEGSVRTAVHRLRKRFGELLRAEIAQTVASPEELEEEIQHLFKVLE